MGTVESIADITPETLYHCHNIFYNPGNMALAVVGDVDPERVRDTAIAVLPAVPGARPTRDYGAPEGPLPFRTRFSRNMQVSAPQFMLGIKINPLPKGNELLRQKLVCDAALSYLYSQSSPFFHRLYEQGLLNTDFYADADAAADTMTILAGGESRDPEKVLEAFVAEAERAGEEGLDSAYFSRLMRAGYGSRIRALSSFSGLAASLVDGDFGDYHVMDAFSMHSSLTEAEVQEFIREHLRPERFALSVIMPGGPADA